MACRSRCAHGACRRHREMVREYHAARDAQDAQAELVGVGYKTETASFYEDNPPVTFRRWLEQTRAVQH